MRTLLVVACVRWVVFFLVRWDTRTCICMVAQKNNFFLTVQSNVDLIISIVFTRNIDNYHNYANVHS